MFDKTAKRGEMKSLIGELPQASGILSGIVISGEAVENFCQEGVKTNRLRREFFSAICP
jgi:hypothetical protein